MFIPGHLTFAYLTVVSHPPKGPRPEHAWFALWFGALLPDLMDKSLRLVGLTPHGRSVGHSLVLTVLLLLGVALLSRRAPRHQWFGWLTIGVGTHLIADLYNDVDAGLTATGYIFSAWFMWPWLTPDDWTVKLFDDGVRCSTCATQSEYVTLLLALWIAFRIKKRTFTPQPTLGVDGGVAASLRRPGPR